jgi:hypothetical protein
MKRLLVAIFAMAFVSLSFADDLSIMDLKNDFYGTWYSRLDDPSVAVSYDISAEMMTFRVMPGSDYEGGITLQIDKWEFITNPNRYSDYPNGFIIYGSIIDMFGFWMGEDIGDTRTFNIYLCKDKNSFLESDSGYAGKICLKK